MPQNKSKLPVVVDNNGVAKSQERHAMPRLNIDANQFTKPDGTLDHVALGRLLTRMQDSYTEGTAATRSHPLAKMCVLTNVTLVSGHTYNLKHTLGEPFARYNPLRSYALPGQGVTSIKIVQGGSGYPSTVTVNIDGPDMSGGVSAKATAAINNGAIQSITITQQGFGYSRVPTVSISAGSGGGASLTASLGVAYSGAWSVSEISSSSWPGGVTPDQYLVLYSNCTGIYDIGVYGS